MNRDVVLQKEVIHRPDRFLAAPGLEHSIFFMNQKMT